MKQSPIATTKWLCLGIVAGLTSVVPCMAQAACLAPSPKVLWSFPADGDVDVPLDADFLLIADSSARSVRVELDGESLRDKGDVTSAFDLGMLQPHTAYTLTVHLEDRTDIVEDMTDTVEDVTIRFETGDQLAGPLPSDLGVDQVAVSDQFRDDVSVSCAEILRRDECFDTPGALAVTLDPNVTDEPLLWVVEGVNEGQASTFYHSPSECGRPEVWTFNPERHTEFVLHAISQNGDSVASEAFPVSGADEEPMGPSDADEAKSGGDAVESLAADGARGCRAAPGERAGWVPALGFLAWVAHRRRRRV